METIAGNLTEIREKIIKAALAAGRDPERIRLIAVSKKVAPPLLRAALAAGQSLFGENYMQEAKEKIAAVGAGAEWHFIGHLQSNKAKDAARHFAMVHTVDRLKLATELDRHAGLAGRILPVLVQINVSGETQKEGVSIDKAEALLAAMGELPHLAVAGLMTMPPFAEDPEETRPWFGRLRELGDAFAARGYFIKGRPHELSMGMSGDYEVAIEEGATLVRIGTAIFGGRPAPPAV